MDLADAYPSWNCPALRWRAGRKDLGQSNSEHVFRDAHNASSTRGVRQAKLSRPSSAEKCPEKPTFLALPHLSNSSLLCSTCQHYWNHRAPACILVCMTNVTQILSRIEQGDASAAEQLFPLVYRELRKLAAAKLAHEKPGHTLQATALVHEVYLRLVDVERVQHWNSRRHFYAAAAEAMRRILVESARRKQRLKHGGGLVRHDADQVELAGSDSPDPAEVLAFMMRWSDSSRSLHARPSWSNFGTSSAIP